MTETIVRVLLRIFWNKFFRMFLTMWFLFRCVIFAEEGPRVQNVLRNLFQKLRNNALTNRFCHLNSVCSAPLLQCHMNTHSSKTELLVIVTWSYNITLWHWAYDSNGQALALCNKSSKFCLLCSTYAMPWTHSSKNCWSYSCDPVISHCDIEPMTAMDKHLFHAIHYLKFHMQCHECAHTVRTTNCGGWSCD